MTDIDISSDAESFYSVGSLDDSFVSIPSLSETLHAQSILAHFSDMLASFDFKLPPEVLISLLIKMADAEARLASGCSERIELAALIAAFQVARDQVKIDANEA